VISGIKVQTNHAFIEMVRIQALETKEIIVEEKFENCDSVLGSETVMNESADLI